MIPQIISQNNLSRWGNLWETRRAEILSLIEDTMFGRTPEIKFDRISCSLIESAQGLGHVRETYRLDMSLENSSCSMSFSIFYNPEHGKDAHVILNINPFSQNDKILSDPRYSFKDGSIFPAALLVKSGFIAVQCNVDELSADSTEKGPHDIMSIFPPQGSNGWCTIDAWAWAAAFVAHEIHKMGFSSESVTVSGFSRGARTALWAAAKYDIFTSVYACQSGCCGAAMHRGKTGETIRDITTRYPQWSCDNFKKYSGCEEELPFDQHMMLSLIFPRPLYISSAREDRWSCPEKEFESCVLVSAFHEIMGFRGLESTTFPSDSRTIQGDLLAYHVRDGGHDCTIEDWEKAICFLMCLIQEKTRVRRGKVTTQRIDVMRTE